MAGMATGGAGGDQAGDTAGGANGWGLWNMMKASAAAVTPSGQQPGGMGQGQAGQMTNGMGPGGIVGPKGSQQYNPGAMPTETVQLPDGKRLAYRMDYCVRETGNSYKAAVTSHTSYWSNKDIAFFILTKMFPELEAVSLPVGL